MKSMKQVLAGVLAVASLSAPPCLAVAGEAVTEVRGGVYAIVDGAAISMQEFDNELAATVLQKFYHRRPPEDQLAVLRREVGDGLIDRVLLLKEAQQRGIRPDEEKVRANVAAYEQRNRDRQQWQQARGQLMPELVRALQQQSMVAQLEAATRTVSSAGETDLLGYFQSHSELFTQPEQLRLSVILLKVDPSAPPEMAQEAMAKAKELALQLENRADFAALAREHSADSTAREGGDLGFKHRGLLPEGVETVIDKLATGSVSEPLRLLEGVALFKLTERKPAQLKKFDEVRGNVLELWTRDQAESQWRALLAQLRGGADITRGADNVRAAAGISGMPGGIEAR